MRRAQLALSVVCFLSAVGSFYVTARWNRGLWLCVVAYLAAALLWSKGLGKNGTIELRSKEAKGMARFLYLTFALCVIGGVWGEYANLVLFGVGVTDRSLFKANNILFFVLVCEIIVVKRLLGGLAADSEGE